MRINYIYHTLSIIQSFILPFIADDKLKEYVTNVLYSHLSYFIIDSIIELYKKETYVYVYHHILVGTATYVALCNIDEINFHEFREDNTYNELLKDPFYKFHEKRIREDIEREGDLDKLYEGLE